MSAEPIAKMSDAGASIVRRILDTMKEIIDIVDALEAENARQEVVREASNKLFQKGNSDDNQPNE